jgi:hypothetical protein
MGPVQRNRSDPFERHSVPTRRSACEAETPGFLVSLQGRPHHHENAFSVLRRVEQVFCRAARRAGMRNGRLDRARAFEPLRKWPRIRATHDQVPRSRPGQDHARRYRETRIRGLTTVRYLRMGCESMAREDSHLRERTQ